MIRSVLACVLRAALPWVPLASAAVTAADGIPWAQIAAARGGGLVVCVAGADARPALDAAGSGSFLVQCLGADAAQHAALRGRIAAAGRLGQVSARVWPGGRLPFGTDTVDLLLLDPAAAGGALPDAAEVVRVLAPGGESWMRQDGGWRRTPQPRDARHGSWTHFLANAQGTNAGDDTAVGPSARLRFNVSDHVLDIRAVDGVLVHLNGTVPRDERGRGERVDDGMVARSAYSGVPLWTIAGGMPRTNHGPEAFVADARRAVWFPEIVRGHAAAYDLRSGRELLRYTQGITHEASGGKGGFAYCLQALVGGRLFQAKERELVALDAEGGRRLWSWSGEHLIRRLVVAPDGGRCYVLLARGEHVGGRWRSAHEAAAIACIADGRALWSNGELVSSRANDLALLGEDLYCYTSATNMDPEDGVKAHGPASRPVPHVVRLRAADGTRVWHTSTGPMTIGGGRPWLNNIVVRDDGVWGSPAAQHFALADGATRQTAAIDLNYRCVRMAGSRDWLLYGFNVWQHRDGHAWNAPIARGDCAQPAYLAQGAVYVPNNIVCNCLVQLHGLIALHQDDEPRPLDAAARTMPPLATPAEIGPDQAPPGPLALDWKPHWLATWLLDRAPTTQAGDIELAVDTDRGRLVASRGGRTLWTHVADARLYARPLVDGERCFVAGADGTITCLELATGRPRWRFLAALGAEQVVIDGQVESRWPVYGMVLHEGAVAAAAGRQDSLDGGIALWGLDPASGAPRWSFRLHTPIRKSAPRGGKAQRAEDRGVVNGGLAIDAGRLVIGSPLLAKQGSSPSRTGYYRWPKDVEPWSTPGRPVTRRHVLDPQAMDGKVLGVGDLAAPEVDGK